MAKEYSIKNVIKKKMNTELQAKIEFIKTVNNDINKINEIKNILGNKIDHDVYDLIDKIYSYSNDISDMKVSIFNKIYNETSGDQTFENLKKVESSEIEEIKSDIDFHEGKIEDIKYQINYIIESLTEIWNIYGKYFTTRTIVMNPLENDCIIAKSDDVKYFSKYYKSIQSNSFNNSNNVCLVTQKIEKYLGKLVNFVQKENDVLNCLKVKDVSNIIEEYSNNHDRFYCSPSKSRRIK